MSETGLYIGKLKKIDLKGESIEEYCERRCREKNIKKESFDSWLDAWNEAHFFSVGFMLIEEGDLYEEE